MKKLNFIGQRLGDKFVKEMMKKYKFNLGGEQSGHIILGKFATTGDGILVALRSFIFFKKEKKKQVNYLMFLNLSHKL